MKYTPQIVNEEVDIKTAEVFKGVSLIPCFSFIDPAGYKGLSLSLIEALGKDYGSDLIFFFNYNDIQRGVSNDRVKEHMEQLFGVERYYSLMKHMEDHDGSARKEAVIVNEMAAAVKEVGLKYVLPFRFKMEQKERTSHYLIFASKHFIGFDIMKSIMSNAGEQDSSGVGKFEFIPSCDKKFEQLSIIDLYNTSQDELKNRILKEYKGKCILFEELYKIDSPNNKYLEKDYRRILLELEDEGRVEVLYIGERRGKALNPKKAKILFK